MATVCGFVEKIKYRNEENGYTVLSLVEEGEEYTLVFLIEHLSLLLEIYSLMPTFFIKDIPELYIFSTLFPA